jgi:hypothetical protein
VNGIFIDIITDIAGPAFVTDTPAVFPFTSSYVVTSTPL